MTGLNSISSEEYKALVGAKKVKRGLGAMTVKQYRSLKNKKSAIKSKAYHLTPEGKQEFIDQCVLRGLPAPIPEYKPFERSLKRNHAVDFMFDRNGIRMALEIEGWGHRTKKRYDSDIWKYNQLAIHGIHYTRVKPKDLYSEETFKLISDFYGTD